MRGHRGLSFILFAHTAFGQQVSVEAHDQQVLEQRISANREQLQQGRADVAELAKEVEEQQKLLMAWLERSKSATVKKAPAQPPATVASTNKPAMPPSGIRLAVAAGQEIATANARTPSFQLGPAAVRIQGYVGLSGIFRSDSMGGGPGTSFAGVPIGNTPASSTSEFRATTQTSRLALRIDVPLKKDKLAAYVEADFSGAVPGNALISSSSYGFRVRHSWITYQHSKFEASAGQMFSLLTPSRGDIEPFPADASTTQAVDTNYVAGLVWDRAPSVRFVYRPNKKWAFGASIENPEQQVGSFVRFPSGLNDILSNQYNTGRAELRTPNPAPDTILKVAWNTNVGRRKLHVDAGSVFRFFRSVDAASITAQRSALGIGGNLNTSFDVTSKLRLLGNAFASSGGGRYIGGVVPDVIVRADGQISPIKAYSWIAGAEWTASRKLSYYGYYSGVYADRNTARDVNGSLIGFGFSGSTAARRSIQEWTGGWSQSIWSGEDAGSLQYGVQYSWLNNNLWAPGAAPPSTNAHMVFTQLRYNLP